MENKRNYLIFEKEAKIHIEEIYRVALRMTRDIQHAEELAQETFLQAWKSFDKYQEGTNCRAWLHQILINKRSHSNRKRVTRSKYFQDTEEFVLTNATNSNTTSEDLTDKSVIDEVDSLAEHYRTVILLVDVYEFKYKEVSKILEIPIGTVMSRLNRARAMLRNSLATVAEEMGIVKDAS